MVFVVFCVSLKLIMKRHSILTMTSGENPALEISGSVNTADLPLLPLRDTVLFPGVVFPVQLGREASLKVARASSDKHIIIGVVAQKNPSTEHPRVPDDFHHYGVLASVINVFDLPDGSSTALVHAGDRFQIVGEGIGEAVTDVPSASIKIMPDTRARRSDREYLAMVSLIRKIITSLVVDPESGERSMELENNLNNLSGPEEQVNFVICHSPIDVARKIELLSLTRAKERAEMLLTILSQHEQLQKVMETVKERTRRNLEEGQRNAFLQAQLESIRTELYGDNDDASNLRKRAAETKFPEDVARLFEKEVSKLERLNPASPDYAVQYSYLETLLDLPWNIETPVSTDFNMAEEVLNADHYGLEKVKERVLEQLAVIMHTPQKKSPIICLVGAPGVGKTSLGRSIAAALGRKYRRVSLGGLHDEAEVRGHRRTYIGAMPGRIIDAMRRCGSSNPLLLLDEIDKIGNDFRGDPSAALLEVLDPEQNSHFHDNYIDIDYDLSKVMFIATANTLSTVPQPLIDRMEVIDMAGYLLEEKIEIALRHLVPRALEANGYSTGDIHFEREAIIKIIEGYTAESGVRQLEKQISAIVRKIVLKKMRSGEQVTAVTPDDVVKMLGVERYTRDRYEAGANPGVATGLAWTAVGGEILFIESSFAKGKGEKLTLTGNLGDVMKESAMIALQYVRAHTDVFSIDASRFDDSTLHIHVPEGAIPKDGPSAGITMATSIISAATGRPVKPRLAMTGEITLRGKVLPVGGIKEKILAAKRAGITEIVLSEQNRKDIEDIRADYLEGLTFHYVGHVDEVVKIALED